MWVVVRFAVVGLIIVVMLTCTYACIRLIDFISVCIFWSLERILAAATARGGAACTAPPSPTQWPKWLKHISFKHNNIIVMLCCFNYTKVKHVKTRVSQCNIAGRRPGARVQCTIDIPIPGQTAPRTGSASYLLHCWYFLCKSLPFRVIPQLRNISLYERLMNKTGTECTKSTYRRVIILIFKPSMSVNESTPEQTRRIL